MIAINNQDKFMEPTQPNPPQPNQQQQHDQQQQQIPQPELALRSYFLQQGQSINKLHAFLQSNLFAYGFKAFASVLLQIICYLLFAFAIYLAIIIPTDLPGLYKMMNGNSSIELTYHDNRITEFLFGLKIVIAVISLPVLACAVLLGRNRRKSAKLRQAFSETEIMKNNFNRALQEFRF